LTEDKIHSGSPQRHIAPPGIKITSHNSSLFGRFGFKVIQLAAVSPARFAHFCFGTPRKASPDFLNWHDAWGLPSKGPVKAQ
jgi:hypothetical protein